MTAPSRPRVLVNFATSLDGKINPGPGRRTGKFMMSRGREDLRRMRALRTRSDAVLIGAENLRADDPDLAIPEDERTVGRREPLRVVVTRAGEGLTSAMKMFDRARGGPALVVHTARMLPDTRARLAPVAELVELGQDRVSMPDLLAWFHARGVRTLLCEGGGELSAELFAARAVDELYLTLTSRILGGARAATMVGGPGFDPGAIPDGKLASLERVGDELYLRYEFAWG